MLAIVVIIHLHHQHLHRHHQIFRDIHHIYFVLFGYYLLSLYLFGYGDHHHHHIDANANNIINATNNTSDGKGCIISASLRHYILNNINSSMMKSNNNNNKSMKKLKSSSSSLSSFFIYLHECLLISDPFITSIKIFLLFFVGLLGYYYYD